MSLTRDADVLTGVADYTVIDQDTIVIDPFTISVNAGVSYDLSGSTLLRDGSIFYGTITNLSNGALYDSLIFSLELTNIPDADFDGVPDISDDAIEDALPAIIQWFNTGGGETAVYTTDEQWHWNYKFKGTKYLPDAPNYIWMREFGAAAYPVRDSGVGSPAGAWYYFFKFPEASVAGGTWVYLSINNFPNRMNANNSVMEGWVYLAGEPYAKWYRVKEFDTIAVADRGTYLFVGDESYRLTTTP